MPQCSSCQFQNMPGTTHCGRCGASLLLATARINVHPPRATKWAKTWRKTMIWRAWYAINQPIVDFARQLDVDPDNRWHSIFAALRLIIPGWPQFVASKFKLGGFLLGGYLACGLLAVIFYGTTIGSLLIATAITIHSIAVYDVARSSTKDYPVRNSRILLGCGLLGTFLYLPLFNLVPYYAAPFSIQIDRDPLLVGDVLLVNRGAYVWAPPQVGDIVVYVIAPAQVGGVAQGRNAVINITLQRIDRVLAGPGQSVMWDGKTLTIDGQPATHRPLNLAFSALPLTLIVPPQHYFILPSGERLPELLPNGESLASTLSIIPIDNIQGRVFWRNSPWSRMGSMR
ncbi:MAG: hypothetical protein JWN70_2110 [Planctomycetaceae bacterium]|nr:hypothetical protein [Planctomycetaceae bacterium]